MMVRVRYLNLIFPILQFDISSWIFSKFELDFSAGKFKVEISSLQNKEVFILALMIFFQPVKVFPSPLVRKK